MDRKSGLSTEDQSGREQIAQEGVWIDDLKYRIARQQAGVANSGSQPRSGFLIVVMLV